jgi:hypothetical protein
MDTKGRLGLTGYLEMENSLVDKFSQEGSANGLAASE